MPHRAFTPLLGAALVAGLGVLAPTTAHALPAARLLTQQGRLFDENQAAISGEHQLEFRIYDALTDGNLLWHEMQSVLLANGYYSVTLGTDNDNLLLDSIFIGHTVYLALVLDNGDAFTPRQLVTAVPFAVQADVATSLQGGAVDSQSLSINGTQVVDSTGNWVGPRTWLGTTLDGLSCTTGQIPTRTAVGWGCASPTSGTSSGSGTIYTAGAGINIDSSNTISVATGGVPLTKLAQGSCNSGDLVGYNGTSFACSAPSNSTVAVANGGTGLTTLGTAGQVLAVNSTATALQYVTPPANRTVVNGFTVGALASGQASTQLNYVGTTGVGFVAPYAGTLRAVCVMGDAAATGGTATFTVFAKSGSGSAANTPLNVVIDATSAAQQACSPTGATAVAAGDVLDIRVVTDGNWKTTATNWAAHFVLE